MIVIIIVITSNNNINNHNTSNGKHFVDAVPQRDDGSARPPGYETEALTSSVEGQRPCQEVSWSHA